MLTICPVFCILKSGFFALFCMKLLLQQEQTGVDSKYKQKSKEKQTNLPTYVYFFL